MPAPSILKSLYGRRFGLGPNNEPIFNDEDRKGLANAQAPVFSIVKGQLSSAQILALNATPIEIIAAPGAGYAIEIEEVKWFLDYNTTGYTAGAGDDLVLRYTDGTGEVISEPADGADFLDATADTLIYCRGMMSGDGQGVLMTANAAVVAHIQTSEITGGDSPINYEVHYRVVPSTLPSS